MVNDMTTKEICFIGFTALLSVAVIFAVVYAAARFKSRRTSFQSLAHTRRTSKSLGGVEDSPHPSDIQYEKVLNDKTFSTSLTQISIPSMPCSVHSLLLVSGLQSTRSEQDIASYRSHSRSRTTSASLVPPSVRNSGHGNEDLTASLSLHAGLQVLSRRGRPDSMLDSIASSLSSSTSLETIASVAYSVAFASANGSSMTSVQTTAADSLNSVDEEDEGDYQVHRAQTQSMEVRRAVLLTASRGSTYQSQLSPIIEPAEEFEQSQDTIRPSHYLSGVSTITAASIATLRPDTQDSSDQSLEDFSFETSESVDLSDFPLPPSAF